MGFRNLWRRIGGLVAVLMAFAVMFAPVAEAAVCADETPATAASHVDGDAVALSQAAAAADSDHGRAAPDVGGDLGLCQHGHCHHAAPSLPVLVADVAVPATTAGRVARLQTQHLRSLTASRLERPPRA